MAFARTARQGQDTGAGRLFSPNRIARCGSRPLFGLLALLVVAAPAVTQTAPDTGDRHGVGILLAPHLRQEIVPAPLPRAVVPAADAAPAINGLALPLPQPPQRGPVGGTAIANFVENLSTNDSAFEVIVGESRLLTLKENLAVPGQGKPIIAVSDPSVLDFSVVGPRQIRVIGQRLGVTDLAITTADGRTFTFEVQVVADLNVLRAQLRATFPEASLQLVQVRDTLVVEGQARDTFQVARVIDTIRGYLLSVQVTQARRISGQSGAAAPGIRPPGQQAQLEPVPSPTPVLPGREIPPAAAVALPEAGQLSIEARLGEPKIINLIKVPGPQQVLLKVRVAELNRTAMREIGADFLAVDHDTGAIVGSQIGGAAGVAATGIVANRMLTGTATDALGPSGTLFGIFEKGDFQIFLRALRRNLIMKMLAEPNLVAMNGQQASFLAGGEFPVPVPQVGASGVAPTITVQFKEFGVRLGFVPFIIDGDVIRLTVDPEVSTIDFSIGTVLVAGGSVVPGLNTRKAHTTVEMRQGQTLMIAGLLQLTMDGQTTRIPGLGDLPILGPFFSNTTGQRTEKELVVLVTPYLIEPLCPGQVPATPGDEVKAPNDLELYFLSRIEGRTGFDFRATTEYDDPFHLIHHLKLEKKYLNGPCGFSD